MADKPLVADQYAGLRPFYQLCWLGLGCSLTALLLVSGNLRASHLGSFVPFLPGVVVVGIAVAVGSWFRKKALTAQSHIEASARNSETARLKHKLDLVRNRVRELTNVSDVDVLLVPGQTVSAWVIRSRKQPLIQVTSAFWFLYQRSPELEGAMAHEAGHVVARDVEHFHSLYYLVSVVAGAWALFVPVGFVMLFSTRSDALSSFLALVGTLGFSAMAIGGTWSALLIARELQADAYAVTALGDSEPIKTFLQRQQELRQQEVDAPSVFRGAWRSIIQPNLTWRMSFPVLHGMVGSRVELMLGLGIFGAFMVLLWPVFLITAMLERNQANTGVIWPAWLIVFAATIALLWIAYQFLWYRNQYDGRDIAFIQSLRTWAWFSLPSAALWVVLLRILYLIRRPPEMGHGEWLLAITALPLTSLLLWAASNLANVWNYQLGRTRPSIAHAIAGLAVVLVTGTVGTVVLSMLFDHDASSNIILAINCITAFLIAALGVGYLSYRKLDKRRCMHVESG